jgi:uncharacterized membrane protein (DUF4010 family)
VRRLWPAVAAAAVVLTSVAVLVYRGSDSKQPDPKPAGRPFALRPALILAAVLTVALLLGRWGADVLGPQGAVLVAGAAGLADAPPGRSRRPASPPRAMSPSIPR